MTFKHKHIDYLGNVVSEIEYKVYGDEGIDSVMQEFRRFLLAVSFQPGTVDKYIEAE